MQQHTDHIREKQLAAVRAKLAKGLRAGHDLMEPLAPRLVELLQKLDGRAVERETTEARLYAEVDESIAALIRLAPGKQGE